MPSVDAVSQWYMDSLRAMGADVSRDGSSVTFNLNARSLFLGSAGDVLVGVAGGDLEIVPAATGIDVIARANIRTWPILLLGAFSVAVAGVLPWMFAFGGVPIAAWMWAVAQLHLGRYLRETNEAIARHFALGSRDPACRPSN